MLVVDCDVHQGDGTARIFAGRPEVLTLSLHAERNYPARKAALARWTSRCRTGWATAPISRCWRTRWPRPRPSGRTSSSTTPGSIRTPATGSAGWRSATRGCAPATRGCSAGRAGRGLPLAAVLGGGYDDDPERLAARHAILFEEAARVIAQAA